MTGPLGDERMTTGTDVEVKNASIKITLDDVTLSIEFQGLGNLGRTRKHLQAAQRLLHDAQTLLKRMEDVANEFSGQLGPSGGGTG